MRVSWRWPNGVWALSQGRADKEHCNKQGSGFWAIGAHVEELGKWWDVPSQAHSCRRHLAAPQAPFSLCAEPLVVMMAPPAQSAWARSCTSIKSRALQMAHIKASAFLSGGTGGVMISFWHHEPGAKCPALSRPEIGVASTGKVVSVDHWEQVK